MSKFIIAVGHTASGNAGCGAVDNLDESNCTREIAPLVCKYLEQEGNETHLLRIDKGNSYNCEDCYTRANQANSIGSDWYVEIHLNSGKSHTGDGAEVCVSSVNSEVNAMASRVATNLSNALGISNRGVKTESLIVLKRTNMKAILVECMFVDGNNPSIYNADIIAKAIAEGLLGTSINTKPVLGWNKSKDGTKWWYCTDVTSESYYKSEWKLIDNRWYLFDSNGFCYTGWISYIASDKKEIWYYLDPVSCAMATGWKKINGEYYYFDSTGLMMTGWIKDGGKDYLLYSNGAMVHDCDLYNYHFSSSGEAKKIQ